VRLEGLDQVKDTIDLIGNRTRIFQDFGINERALLDDSCMNVYPGRSQ
jgi:hypothetical protein